MKLKLCHGQQSGKKERVHVFDNTANSVSIKLTLPYL
jgi:hypothetical protein